MLNTEAENLFDKGIEALNHGETLSALTCFEKALELENKPVLLSYFALCIAKERGQLHRAISLCKDAIRNEPENSVLYLNLGRIHLFMKNKEEAINVFRQGLKYRIDAEIINELNTMGIRKPPVIPFLKRSNPINKYLGFILKRLGLR